MFTRKQRKKSATLALVALWSAIVFSPVTMAQELNPLVDYRLGSVVIRKDSGVTLRSAQVTTAFKKQWACPATNSHVGACPGWAIDHIIPLACGGKDAVWNMQWLPNEIKSARGEFSKDHFERKIYGGNNMSKGCP